MKLSKTDAALLWDFYESDSFQALKRVLEAQKFDIAVVNLQSATLEQLNFNRGQIRTIEWLLSFIEKNYQKRNKR